MSDPGQGDRLPAVLEGLRREVEAIRRSRKRLAEAADADRRAIERLLHDGVQQHLVALAVDLQRAAQQLDADPAAAKATLDEMAANVRAALDEATELAQTIYPPLLGARGLASALRSAAERAGVTVRVDVPAAARCPVEIATAVYWCCVEAFSSAVAGSAASVSVLDADGAVTFEVAVAGRHPDSRLDRIRDRIEALGGRVTVQDAQGGGSRIQGVLPMPG